MSLVSIIVPCHNAAPWLAETLESAVAQTWIEKEIIVVDDGSTDLSLETARAFQAQGVRIATQANRGASAARNHGIGLSRGDWVQFLDADDVLAPDKIERQMECLSRAPAGSVASGSWARFYSNPSEAVFTPEPSWRDLSGLEFLLLHYAEGWMMPPIAWLTPRVLVEKVGPWREDLSLNDDGEYFCRVLLASRGIVFCPDSRSYYRSGLPGSLSRRADRRSLQSLWLANQVNCDRILAASNQSAQARAAAANGWQRLAFECYPVAPDLADEAEKRCEALGGSPYPLPVTGTFRKIAAVLGWRAAKRLQRRFKGKGAPSSHG